jgi:hypothetical protein
MGCWGSPRDSTSERFRVELDVKPLDFTEWLERTDGSPREVSDRHRTRSILGMLVSQYNQILFGSNWS